MQALRNFAVAAAVDIGVEDAVALGDIQTFETALQAAQIGFDGKGIGQAAGGMFRLDGFMTSSSAGTRRKLLRTRLSALWRTML